MCHGFMTWLHEQVTTSINGRGPEVHITEVNCQMMNKGCDCNSQAIGISLRLGFIVGTMSCIDHAHLIVECQLSAEVVVDVLHLSGVLSSDDQALIPGSLHNKLVHERQVDSHGYLLAGHCHVSYHHHHQATT